MTRQFIDEAEVAITVLDLADMLVCVLDKDGRIVLFNAACEISTGFKRDEVVGKSIWDVLIPDEQLHSVRAIFEALAAGGAPSRHESYWLTKSGGRRLISWKNAATNYAGGDTPDIIGTGVDITDQRRAEQTAREKDARLGAVLKASADGIITIDEKGVVTSFSPGAEALFGYEAESVIGNNVKMLMPPPYREEHDGYLGRYEKTGERRIIGLGREVSALRKDGTVFPIQLAVDEVRLGGQKFYTGIIHDISARRRLETIQAGHQEALERLAGGAELDRVLQVLAETAEDVMPKMLCSILLLERPSRRLRLGAAPSLPQFFNQMMEGLKLGEGGPACITACETKEIVIIEDISKHEECDPEFRGVAEKAGVKACWAHPIISTSDEVLGSFAMYYRDPKAPSDAEKKFVAEQARLAAISIERHRAQDQLRQATKMESIGRLTGGMAHDFNNLLTVIQGNLEMLETRLSDPENRDMLEEAQEATALGGKLTQQMLAFARRQPLQSQAVDVNNVIIEMMEILRRTLGGSIRVSTVLSNSLWPSLADPSQLQNVVLNLALNARDAMQNGGTLIIETENVDLDEDAISQQGVGEVGQYVRIAVADDGVGMSEEIREKIFEPFYTTKESGSGLGLSMVYGFIKQSNGHISVYSEEGYGTTFNLYLPRTAKDVEGESAQTKKGETLPTGTEIVLAVEDDPRVRRITTRRLKDLGYSVLEAEDAAAALRLVDGNAVFDLVFTDLIMPGGMNGRELAEEIRKRRPDAKIVFTSGYADPTMIEEGLDEVGGLFLRKPYSQSQLADTIRRGLDDL